MSNVVIVNKKDNCQAHSRDVCGFTSSIFSESTGSCLLVLELVINFDFSRREGFVRDERIRRRQRVVFKDLRTEESEDSILNTSCDGDMALLLVRKGETRGAFVVYVATCIVYNMSLHLMVLKARD